MNSLDVNKDLATAFTSCSVIPASQVRCGLVVRIPGFHPGGPGSIPGTGIFSFIHYFYVGFRIVVSLFHTKLFIDTPFPKLLNWNFLCGVIRIYNLAVSI